MILDLLRLVLVSKAQTSIFQQPNADLPRDTILKKALTSSTPIPFPYRNEPFFFTTEDLGEETDAITSGFIVGKIGRRRRVIEHEAPEAGFTEFERIQWVASSIFIDPFSHADGQKIAFESSQEVGQPLGIAKALFNQLNLSDEWPYIFEVNAIAEPDSFWDYEKRNKGVITEVSFELIAPNMFGTKREIDREMTELRDQEKAVSTTLTLKNPAGLSLETDRIKETVDYSLRGGGKIKARTRGRKKRYNSEDQVRKVELPEEVNVAERSMSSLIGRVIDRVFSLE